MLGTFVKHLEWHQIADKHYWLNTKKMRERYCNQNKVHTFKVGHTVALRIPRTDRAATDHHFLCIVVQRLGKQTSCTGFNVSSACWMLCTELVSLKSTMLLNTWKWMTGRRCQTLACMKQQKEPTLTMPTTAHHVTARKVAIVNSAPVNMMKTMLYAMPQWKHLQLYTGNWHNLAIAMILTWHQPAIIVNTQHKPTTNISAEYQAAVPVYEAPIFVYQATIPVYQATVNDFNWWQLSIVTTNTVVGERTSVKNCWQENPWWRPLAFWPTSQCCSMPSKAAVSTNWWPPTTYPILGSKLQFTVLHSESVQIWSTESHWICIFTIDCHPGMSRCTIGSIHPHHCPQFTKFATV